MSLRSYPVFYDQMWSERVWNGAIWGIISVVNYIYHINMWDYTYLVIDHTIIAIVMSNLCTKYATICPIMRQNLCILIKIMHKSYKIDQLCIICDPYHTIMSILSLYILLTDMIHICYACSMQNYMMIVMSIGSI